MADRKYGGIYKAIVEEIIKDTNEEPTFELRVRAPVVHFGLKKEDLPIARPITLPGLGLDAIKFIDDLEKINYVYVIFEDDDMSLPIYFIIGGFDNGV